VVGSRREAIAMLDTALPHADDVGPNFASGMCSARYRAALRWM
jgi:hypothetical protein